MSSTSPCRSHVPDPPRVCLGGPNGIDTWLTKRFSSLPSTQPLAMPARISPDTDSSRIATVCAFHLVLSTLHTGKTELAMGSALESNYGQVYQDSVICRESSSEGRIGRYRFSP